MGADAYREADVETMGDADVETVGGAPVVERRTRETLDALVAMAEILVDDEGTPDAPGREHGGARVVGRRLAELTRHVLGCRRLSIVALDPVTGLQHPVAVVGLSPEQERQWWTGTEGAPLSSEGAGEAGGAGGF